TETPAFFATATIDMLHIPEKTRRPRKYTRRLPRLPIFAPLQTSRLSINLIHMNGRDITALGYREGPLVGLALRIAKRAIKRQSRAEVDEALKALLATPEAYASDT